MNRTSAKRGFSAFFAMFLLIGGMLFLSNNVSAQTAPPKIDISGIVWMTESQALDVLTTTINGVQQQMAPLTPGSPGFNAGMRRAVFLKSIHAGVSGGTSVVDAFLSTLDLHNNDGAYLEKPQAIFTLPQAMDEAEYAIAILRTN